MKGNNRMTLPAQQDPASTQQPAPSATKDDKSPAENMIPKSRFDEVIRERDDARKKAEAMEKAQQELERKRLEESQEYKKLYESTLADVTALKPKAEQLESYEKTLTAILEREVEELPDEFKDVVPDGLSTQAKLDWLAKNKSKFTKAEPFDIGAGRRGTQPVKKTELTPEQKEMAKRFGMSEEDYAKNL
jgi:hypothetical protein